LPYGPPTDIATLAVLFAVPSVTVSEAVCAVVVETVPMNVTVTVQLPVLRGVP
jgi:hypothetical protein